MIIFCAFYHILLLCSSNSNWHYVLISQSSLPLKRFLVAKFVFFLKIYIFFYLFDCTGSCGSMPDLVTWPGVKLRSHALRAWNLNCCTSRKSLNGHISLFIFLSPTLVVFSIGDCVFFLTTYFLVSLRPQKALPSL